MSPVDFLNRQKGPAVLPTAEGGAFVSSVIGKFTTRLFWQILSQEDIESLLGIKADAKQPAGQWGTTYFFSEYEIARKALENMNADVKSPQEVWLFQAFIDTVLNIEDKSKWGNTAVFTLNLKSYASAKYRHEEHLIGLPAAVAAYADYAGFPNAGFDLKELIEWDDDQLSNEWASAYLIGHPDAKSANLEAFQVAEDLARAKYGSEAREVVRRLVTEVGWLPAPNDVPESVIVAAKEVQYIHWEKSALFDRREKLWVSLGEGNPKLFQPIGSKTAKGDPSKFACVEQTNLETCVGVLAYEWDQEVWCRVTNVFDPRKDAYSKGTGNRLKVPALVKIYGSEAEARADAEAELKARKDGDEYPVIPTAKTVKANDAKNVVVTTTTAPAPTSTPTVSVTSVPFAAFPAAWMNGNIPLVSEWENNVRKMKVKYPGPKEVFAIQVQNAEATGVLKQEHACTAQEAIDWYDRV